MKAVHQEQRPDRDLQSYRIATHLKKSRAVCDRIDQAEAAYESLRKTFSPEVWSILEGNAHILDIVSSRYFLLLASIFGKLLLLGRRWRLLFASFSASSMKTPRPDALASTTAPNFLETDEDLAEEPAFRIYIDITAARAGYVGGGIKRVCLEIGKALNRSMEAQPCVTCDGELFTVVSEDRIGERIRLRTSDIYLILDSFWEPFEDYKRNLENAKRKGIRTAVCVHDAIPLSNPKLIDDAWADWFRECYVQLLPYIDLIVSVSQVSAEEVAHATKRLGFERPVVWFHLGANAFTPPRSSSLASGRSFVSIGTLEPKKGYEVALDAFDMVWSSGADVTYTIIGKAGWICSALISRMEQHTEFGKRLIWLDDASDEEVVSVLEHSFCYLQASLAEGFGLPLVEAASMGLPIIASDLAVFREISTEGVIFFPVCDTCALAECILNTLKTRPAPAKALTLTWDQSATALVATLKAQAAAEAF